MAISYNLFVDQGATFSANVTVKDNSNIARDLSGYTARSQMRRSHYSTNSTVITTTIGTPASGNVTLALTNAQTANLKPGRHVYDVEIVSSANVVERVFEGIVTVYPEVTR
jgi:hypothetical protein